MTDTRAAIIDKDGTVTNVVLLPEDYDPKAEGGWQPPEGTTVVTLADDAVGPGYRYDGKKFKEPEPVEFTPEPAVTNLTDDQREAIEKATTLDEIKAALLGQTPDD